MNTAFKLDKVKVRQSFSLASQTYDGMAQLQRSVAAELVRRYQCGDLSGAILDVGCGTGYLSGELMRQSGDKHIIALDLALPMLQTMRAKPTRTDVVYLCADAEQIPLAGGSVDQVFSSLALQWCVNLDKVFLEVKNLLKPDGRLVFSTFAPGTLIELKSAWAEVDDYRHVNEFFSAEQVAAFLRSSGFKDICIESKTYLSRYHSVMDLMKELKGIGAHNVSDARKKTLTGKSRLRQMISVYQRRWGGRYIPASYEVLMVSARV